MYGCENMNVLFTCSTWSLYAIRFFAGSESVDCIVDYVVDQLKPSRGLFFVKALRK